ncbi:MAG: DUF1553 domain-containing protein [Sedimentisphaerales bacterium]|nr:DUF1553 domain-containing protein [Sedimentisphaerales bacterium]
MSRVLSIGAVLLLIFVCGASGSQGLVRPYEGRAVGAASGRIDKLVFERLDKLGIAPANICSDAVFVRRAYLDVIGTLPSAKDVRDFLADKNAGKRKALIDRLLEREEFADYWSMKWGDLLRVKAEFPINLWPNGVQAYHHWIRSSIEENMAYDRFVREMLTSSGSNFRVPAVNFYCATQSREPAVLAQAVALTFMGERAEKWDSKRLSGMAGFFAQIGYKSTAEWKEVIVGFDPNSSAIEAVFPDGVKPRIEAETDPRRVFADWLISEGNPWFARNIVNRVWSWLLGRGIIHEPDDIRPDNPPVNEQLLKYLEKELVGHHYDLKHIFRLILNSQTYQLSSIPTTEKSEAEANFAHYGLRRIEAEVLIDALNQITGTSEKYSSAVPEPFTFIPQDYRSIALADGSITSSFLEMFGRPPRDTGLESERNNKPSAAQRLHMLNSSHIQRKIERGWKLRSLLRSNRPPKQVINELYLTILSRFPTAEEAGAVDEYFGSGGKNRQQAAVDLAWALINSAEFVYRH